VERHRKGATVITSNRDPSEFLAQMADPLLAQSAVDRLHSAAYELVIEASPTANGKSREPGRGPTSAKHRKPARGPPVDIAVPVRKHRERPAP